MDNTKGKEVLPDGRIVTGMPTNVNADVRLTPHELKETKRQMYHDFLEAKQKGQIDLGYTFDSWLRNSLDTLRTIRKADIDTEYKLGKIGKLEHDALEEMRVKLISAILRMDTMDLDKYGVQYIDPTTAQLLQQQDSPVSQVDNRLLIPQHRKGKVKFKRDN